MLKVKSLRTNRILLNAFDAYLGGIKMKRSKGVRLLLQFFLTAQSKNNGMLKKLLIEKPILPEAQQSDMIKYTVTLEESAYDQFKAAIGEFSVETVLDYLIAYFLKLSDDEKFNIMFG